MSRLSQARVLAVVGLCASAVSCLSTEKEGLQCAAGGQRCPDGQTCHSADNRCWSTPERDGGAGLADVNPDVPPPRDASPDLPPPIDTPVDSAPTKKDRGMNCQSNDECADGWCAPGEKVCCNVECNGLCQTCADGMCRLAPKGAPSPERGACAGQGNGSGCGGFCDGEKPDCQFPDGKSCGQQRCDCQPELGCHETNFVCGGGECKMSGVGCSHFWGCDGTACAASCTVANGTGCYRAQCCSDRSRCRTLGCKPFCSLSCPP